MLITINVSFFPIKWYLKFNFGLQCKLLYICAMNPHQNLKNENEFQQNLDIITQVIKTAQRRYYNDSPYFILWGTAVFLSSLLQFILIQNNMPFNEIGWAISIPLSIIIQIVLIQKEKKKSNSRTHVESLLNSLWIGFGITLFIFLFHSYQLNFNIFPITLGLYALSTFISGTAFKMNSFLVGSIACWIFSILCFYVDFQYQILLLSAGALIAFIIPGITLRIKEKNNDTLTL